MSPYPRLGLDGFPGDRTDRVFLVLGKRRVSGLHVRQVFSHVRGHKHRYGTPATSQDNGLVSMRDVTQGPGEILQGIGYGYGGHGLIVPQDAGGRKRGKQQF